MSLPLITLPTFILFQRGGYGEIKPPFLLEHLPEAEARTLFSQEWPVASWGRDAKTEALWAYAYLQQVRVRVIAKGITRRPLEEALLQALLSGEFVSLAPPMQAIAAHLDFEPLTPLAPVLFVPVLRRIDRLTWQLGLPRYGETWVYKADTPALAVRWAHLKIGHVWEWENAQMG